MKCHIFLALQINKAWEEQKAKKQLEQDMTEPEETIKNLKGANDCNAYSTTGDKKTHGLHNSIIQFSFPRKVKELKNELCS